MTFQGGAPIRYALAAVNRVCGMGLWAYAALTIDLRRRGSLTALKQAHV